MSRTSPLARGLGMLAMMAMVPGCLFSPPKDKPKPAQVIYEPRTTPKAVLNNLIKAYENRDLDRYEELFDTERFLFVFDPVDVKNPQNDVPPSWEWPEERLSTRNMFESGLVQKIRLGFVQTTPAPVVEGDDGERPFPEGTVKVVVTEVHLAVDTRDPEGGENIVYEVPGDRARFFLFQDLDEREGGLPVWKIFEWRDEKVS